VISSGVVDGSFLKIESSEANFSVCLFVSLPLLLNTHTKHRNNLLKWSLVRDIVVVFVCVSELEL